MDTANEAWNDFSERPSPQYALAHILLKEIALAHPLQFLGMAASDEFGAFMDAVLENVAEICQCDVPFQSADVNVHCTRISKYPVAIVEIPQPQEIADAIMVALVVRLDMTGLQETEDFDSVQGRYFTLEKGLDLENNQPRTVLAEWTEESHLNYGDGPEATIDAFCNSIHEMMDL